MEDIREKVMKVLKDLDEDSIADMWNEYCDNVKYYDDKIYPLDEYTINELFNRMKPFDMLMQMDGAFNANDSWFYYNGYGQIRSTDDIFDKVYLDDLADYIIDEENALGDSDIEDILEEAKEYEDED